MRERKKGGKGSIRRKKRNKEKRGKRRDEIFPKISMHERKGNESNSKPQSSPNDHIPGHNSNTKSLKGKRGRDKIRSSKNTLRSR